MQGTSLSNKHAPPLSTTWRWFYAITAFILVAFGQPAWIPVFGLIAACVGYAIFWRVLLCFSSPLQRFWIACLWFFTVQLVQASWFISHPYLYIYGVYLFVAALFGVPFGIIGLLINPRMTRNLWGIITLASLWTIFEWSRLFILSGFPFNPVGIALGGNLYSLQMASLLGVFGLSFWIFLTNLLALKAWLDRQFSGLVLWLAAALTPYIFGAAHLYIHENAIAYKNQKTSPFNTVLVQTAFPVEESMPFKNKQNMVEFVEEEWRKILTVTKQHLGKPIDLIALPEFVVPFGTYANIYAFENVVDIFHEVLGRESVKKLPLPEWPLGDIIAQGDDKKIMVNNAFWVQSIANVFEAGVLAGLEDAEDMPNEEREYYSAAFLFQKNKLQDPQPPPERYEKRILVPMGEYIPFAFCRELAKQYGVFGSFTAGKEAKVMQCRHLKVSPSICYEETYGDLIRESRQIGAEMFVNLTSDVWYPNSRLPLQHLEHARFRTVENGVPLVRACNTGVTGAIDSLGRSVEILGGNSPEKFEWVADALYVQVPTYTYNTLYSQFGDKLIIGISLFVILISACFRQFSF